MLNSTIKAHIGPFSVYYYIELRAAGVKLKIDISTTLFVFTSCHRQHIQSMSHVSRDLHCHNS